MEIEVDIRSATPPYEQIRSQVARLVASGALLEGTQLPPIRQLAGHLGLSNGVVARAYRELERDGLVVTAGKKGTTVAPHLTGDRPDGREKARARALADAASAYAIAAHRLGYTVTDAVTALTRAMAPASPDHPS